MFDKLKAIKIQYEQLLARMQQPETYQDAALFARCDRESRELAPVVEAYNAYEKASRDMDSALELMNDAEFKELAQEEYSQAKADKERLEQEIKILLLPKDPNDNKNVIMEIRGGVGGEEGMLFASDLFRMYSMYAERRGWKIEVANVNETELGGIKEISFVIGVKLEINLTDFRQHRHSCGAGVYPAAGLCDRYALNTVPSRFKLKA